jgi:hypothetical protein
MRQLARIASWQEILPDQYGPQISEKLPKVKDHMGYGSAAKSVHDKICIGMNQGPKFKFQEYIC